MELSLLLTGLKLIINKKYLSLYNFIKLMMKLNVKKGRLYIILSE